MDINTLNGLDLSILDTLSPAEKELALSILKEYSETGESQKHAELKYADYNEIPVDIITFVDSYSNPLRYDKNIYLNGNYTFKEILKINENGYYDGYVTDNNGHGYIPTGLYQDMWTNEIAISEVENNECATS